MKLENSLCSLLAIVPIAACAQTLPDPTPSALYTYITVDDPYSGWALLPGSTAKHVDAAQSHDTHLTTLVNATAYAAVESAQPIEFDPDSALVLPVGSIIVKENYGSGLDQPPSLQVMYKYDSAGQNCGYPECESGWFFTYYSPGQATPDPAPAGHCIACHTGVTVAPTTPVNPNVESASYMLSLSDHVWGLFYQMVQADSTGGR